MPFPLAIVCIALLSAAIAIHLLSVALVLWRLRDVSGADPIADPPALTVLRPVCGLEPGLEEALRSTFTSLTSSYEAIFCIANPTDPAVALVRSVMASYPAVPARLLIGDDRISGNPKLNNLAKGWLAARHDWIVMIDSNVLLPRDYMQILFASWTKGIGLVTSPPAGICAQGLWASVEAGFLNTYQARWQLATDQIGNGFAQGKVLMWQRALLEKAGGIGSLGLEMAEDVASTKVVRAAKLKVRVVRRPFPQPLFQRTAAEVWSRQLRWARVRRAGFPLLFALEPLTFAVLPVGAIAAMAYLGAVPAATAAAYVALWYGAEWALARRADWPASLGQIPAWMLRDALMPLIWLSSFASRHFVWRGNAMVGGAAQLQAAARKQI